MVHMMRYLHIYVLYLHWVVAKTLKLNEANYCDVKYNHANYFVGLNKKKKRFSMRFRSYKMSWEKLQTDGLMPPPLLRNLHVFVPF